METATLPGWVNNASMKEGSKTGPVTCPTCTREFPNEWAARVHYRLKHMGPVVRPTRMAKKAKRKYTKRKMKCENEMSIGVKHQDSHSANWCPCCGTNLKAVNMALAITK